MPPIPGKRASASGAGVGSVIGPRCPTRRRCGTAPIDGIRFVHAAIVNEARAIEELARSVATPQGAGALVPRLEFFAELNDAHTRGEELGLFPPLVERSPNLADTYLLDHEDERALFAEIVTLARQCQSGDDSALMRLRRQTVALTERAELHVRKENELVIPLCREMFSDAEQGAEYLGELSAVMPPPVFDATTASVRDTVGPQRWSELVDRLASLG